MLILFFLQYMLIYWSKIIKKELSLFPTEGEFSQYDLSLFEEHQSTCKMNPYVPYVELINRSKEIYQIKGGQYSSMTSNNTHFVTLSNQNEVFIYEWKNQIIQQVGQPVPIDPSFKCFNINLFLGLEILLDCYKNNYLFLLKIVDTLPNIVYQSESFIPYSTKIQSILNGTNTFIIYAQYFGNYSILSLISAKFQNLTCFSNQFIDFDIPIQISPNIYVITTQDILQFVISTDFKFELTFNLTVNDNSLHQILVYQNIREYSQCDQLLVLQQYSDFIFYYILLYLGCEYQIITSKDFNNYVLNGYTTVPKIFSNNQFIIVQSYFDQILFLSISQDPISFELDIKNTSLLHINKDNELFSFDNDIIAYKISLPKLQINLTNQTIQQYNYDFTLKCIQIQNSRNISIHIYQINLQILSKNDTNIYVIFNQEFPQDILSPELFIKFFSFSGQLLNYAPYQESNLLNYTQTTFQKISEINYEFYLVQFIQGAYDIYLIGYNNYSLSILFCYFDCKQNNSYKLLNQFDISINSKSLKVASSIYPQIIVIGLSDTDTIYLFQQNQYNEICNQQNFTFDQEFSDFLVSYQSIIILIQNQEVQIMSLNFTNKFTLNQQYINKYFNNIVFNPIQIVSNTQFLSSFLYINNVNAIIIVSIDKNNLPIPITLMQTNITIKQINLVNQQLILSYICNNTQNICFQVWNVQNLPKFYYVKSLYSLNYDNQILIQSDNLFFYITFSNHTVYIYNPLLPQHMSLYYMVDLTSPIQCSLAFYYYNHLHHPLYQSTIFQNNSFYLLLENQAIEISLLNDNQVYNNLVRYPQIIYNYQVTSTLNQTAIYHTPNQSITLFSNFTIFQPLSSRTIDLTKENLIFHEKNFTYPMSLILNRQITYCGSTNKSQTYDLSDRCSLSYFAQNTSKITNYQNYSLITSINNQFFALQNNQSISMLYDNLTQITNLNYSNLNLSECLKSTSSNYILHSICQNDTSQYWLIFQINKNDTLITLTNCTKLNQTFSKISKINCILDQIFILGSLYQQLQNQDQIILLYWFNQSNNSFQSITQQDGQMMIECLDFSAAQFREDNFNQQQNSIIIFYILNDNFEIRFQLMQIKSISTIFLTSSNEVVIPNCLTQHCSRTYYDTVSIKPNWIQIIQVNYENVFILLSDTNLNEIVEVTMDQNSFIYNRSFGAIVTTIPNYGNSSNLGNSIYQNGVLMQQFQLKENQNEFIVGTYYFNPLEENINQTEPILMYGSFNTTSNEYAMIVNEKQQIGTCLYFLNNTIYNYSISTWNVTCHYKQNRNNINVSIYCNNSFSNGIYNITFNLPHIDQQHQMWIYTLISIIMLLLILFYWKVKMSIRGRGYINSEIEL